MALNTVEHFSSLSETEQLAIIEQFMQPADSNLVRCQDERQAQDSTNGVELPGGVFVIIDFVKHTFGFSEIEAREYVFTRRIPIGSHVDDHHGPLGCKYADLVQNNPGAVGAVESVDAADRIAWVEQVGGTVMHYQGNHQPNAAIVNWRPGISFDPDQAWERGLRAFNVDMWVLADYAQRLEVNQSDLEAYVFASYSAIVGIAAPHIEKFHSIT